MRRFHCAVVIVGTALLTSAARADAGNSLSTCQKTVAAESARYVAAVTSTVGKCLTKMSSAVLQQGLTTTDAASGAAAACVVSFGKLLNSDAPARTPGAKFVAKVEAKCDPAANPGLQHVEAATYTVGSTTLGAANLSAYCATLGGDGSIDSFAEWRACLHAASDREARAAITVSWPRALEYFEALLPALAALPASPRTTDALAALSDLDAEIEGSIDDDVPDPASGATGMLATGASEASGCDVGLGRSGPCPSGYASQDTIARAGLEASYRDNGDGTITDLVTGLTWEKLSDDGTVHRRLGAYSFEEAFTVKIAALNAGAGFAGHTDWRLPNRRELESLVDSSRFDPAIRPVFADGCPAGCSVLQCSCALAEPYWTSTSYQTDASRHWVVDFRDGFVVPSSAATARVRAVRGGVTAVTSGSGTPSASPPPTLNACQKAVAKESSKYVNGVAATVSKCLGAVSVAVIKNGKSTAEAARESAPACVVAFGKLANSADPAATLGDRFRARVAAKCDPAVNPKLSHRDADTHAVGNRTLSAALLGSYCAALGGDVNVDSFAKWSDCLRSTTDAAARQEIALRWPRALEYFAALRTAIAGLPQSSQQSDALAALSALDASIEGATDDDRPEPPPAPPAGLLVTGQTQCVQDDLAMGACPGSLPGQDGAVRAGIARSYTDNGDGTITDDVTGLVWEKLSDDDSVHDRDHVYQSVGVYLNKVARLNRHGFAGHSDWRVPNARELESLVDAGRAAPAIDPIFDHDCTPGCTVLECSCAASTKHFSSTLRNGLHTAIDFADGSNVAYGGGTVRAVRAGNQPARTYVNQPPVAWDIDVKNPQADCVPVTLLGTDDSVMDFVRITAFPQNGFLASSYAAQIPAAQPDHFPVWGPTDRDIYSEGLREMLPTPDDPLSPPGSRPVGPSGILRSTYCYVTFSSSFAGTDAFTYEIVDNEGNVSNTAIATLTIFER